MKLNKLMKLLPAKGTLNITVNNGTVSFMAVSGDTVIVSSAEVTITSETRTFLGAVDLKEFKSFCSRAKDVELSFDTDHLKVSDSSSFIELQYEQYVVPNLPKKFDITVDTDITIKPFTFRTNRFKKVIKWALYGFLVDFKEGVIVSSDSTRLSLQAIPKQDQDSILLPRTVARQNAKITKIRIANYNVIEVTYEDGVQIIASVIPDRYPLYCGIIPTSEEYIPVKVDGFALKDRLKGKFKNGEIGTIVFRDGYMHLPKGINLKCDYKLKEEYRIKIEIKHLYDFISCKDIELRVYDDSKPLYVTDADGNSIVIMSHSQAEVINKYDIIELKKKLKEV